MLRNLRRRGGFTKRSHVVPEDRESCQPLRSPNPQPSRLLPNVTHVDLKHLVHQSNKYKRPKETIKSSCKHVCVSKATSLIPLVPKSLNCATFLDLQCTVGTVAYSKPIPRSPSCCGTPSLSCISDLLLFDLKEQKKNKCPDQRCCVFSK